MESGGRRGFFTLLLLVLVVALASSGLTAYLMLGKTGGEMQPYVPLAEAAATIERYYYYLDDGAAGEEKRIEGALRGMVEAIGDPYAKYMTAEEYDEMLEEDSGEYTGFGMSVQEPDETGSTIYKVYEGSPMAEAGVVTGDVITHVNGTPTAGLSLEGMMALFPEGDTASVTLTIRRGTETFAVTVTSRVVHVARVKYELLDDRVGFIRIEEFSGAVAREFSDALDALDAQGMEKLVVDVRNNPGGGLTEVLAVTDCVLDRGSLIVTIRSKTEKERVYRAEEDGISLPIAVLVNGRSASASELFTGALADNGKAIVVGTQTYGKGIVQSFFRLRANGGWVKLTTDAYYTPNDVCIQGVGITPDVVAEMPPELEYADLSTLNHADDPQLAAALQALAA